MAQSQFNSTCLANFTSGGFTDETNEQYTEHWGREGFYGDGVSVIRPRHVP